MLPTPSPTALTASLLKRLAVGLLALAMVAVAVALWAGMRAPLIGGPSAIVAMPDGGAWLATGQQLWRLNPAGQRTSQVNWREEERGDMPACLVYRAATEELYTVSREGSEVLVLHADSAGLKRRIALHWPASPRRDAHTALWLAVHDDGRMSLGTGSGHAVVLFDAQGRHLATSKAGTYRYTNDLWWDHDQLWTTDTNGQALVLLNGQTLETVRRFPLDSDHPWRYTALARPHPAAPAGQPAPWATLSRLDGHMQRGRIVNVWPDGHEDTLALGPDAEPVDLAWLHDTLVVLDDHDWRLKRFDLNGEALPDWGDQGVRTDLASTRQFKQRLQLAHRGALFTAVLCLLASVLLLAWSRLVTHSPQSAAARAQLRGMGTRVPPRLTMLRGAASVGAPFLVLLGMWLVLKVVVAAPVAAWLGRSGLIAAAVSIMLFGTVLLALTPWWWRRCAARSSLEPVMNAQPVWWLLRTSTWADHALPEEQLQETWLLRHWRGATWVLFTNQRVWALKIKGWGQQAWVGAWPRADIEDMRIEPWSALTWPERLGMFALIAGVMKIRLRGGPVLAGGLMSPHTARRAMALHQAGDAPPPPSPPSAPTQTGKIPGETA